MRASYVRYSYECNKTLGRPVTTKSDVPQGTLDLMVLKTLALGPMHGYGIVRRLEDITRGTFQINPGTVFPALRRLDTSGFIRGKWARTPNNRRARFYTITASGRRHLERQTRNWEHRMTAVRRVLEADA
jgi:PadR family transcriptional regulator PadR